MTSWSRATGAVWRRSGPAFAVLAVDANEVTVLRGPGADIWELLDRPLPEERLIEALVERLDAGVDEVTAGAQPLLLDLRRRGILASRTAQAEV